MKKILSFVVLSFLMLFPVFSNGTKSAQYMKKAENYLAKDEIARAYYYYTCAYAEDPENNLDALLKNAEIVNYISDGDISLGKGTLDDFEAHDRWKKLINDFRVVQAQKEIKFNGVSTSINKGETDYETRTYSYIIDIHLHTSSVTLENLYKAIEEGLEKVIQPTWKEKEFEKYYIKETPYLISKKYLESKDYLINGTPFSYVNSKNYEDKDKNYSAYSYFYFYREDNSRWRNFECDIELVNSAGKVLASQTVHTNTAVFKLIKEKKDKLSVRVKEIRFYYGDFDCTTKITKDRDSFYCISDENFNKLKTIKFSGARLNPESYSDRVTITDKLQMFKSPTIVYSKDSSLILKRAGDYSVRTEPLPEDFDYDLGWNVEYNQIKNLKTEEELTNLRNVINEKISKDSDARNNRIGKVSVSTKLGDTYIVYDKKHEQVFFKQKIRTGFDEYVTCYKGVPLSDEINLSDYIVIDFERLRDDDEYYEALLTEINNAELIYTAVNIYCHKGPFPKWNEKANQFDRVSFSLYDKKNNRLFKGSEIEKPENPESILALAGQTDSFVLAFDEITPETDLFTPMQNALNESWDYQYEIYFKTKGHSLLLEQLDKKIEKSNTKKQEIYYSEEKKTEGFYKTYLICEHFYPASWMKEQFETSSPKMRIATLEEMNEYKKKWGLKDDVWYFVKYDEKVPTTIIAWNPKKNKTMKIYPSQKSQRNDLCTVYLYEWNVYINFPREKRNYQIE